MVSVTTAIGFKHRRLMWGGKSPVTLLGMLFLHDSFVALFPYISHTRFEQRNVDDEDDPEFLYCCGHTRSLELALAAAMREGLCSMMQS